MGRKQRRAQRDRRHRESRVAAAPVAEPARRVVKAEQKRVAEFEESRRTLERRRTLIGLASLFPLAAPYVGIPFGPLDFLGVPSTEGWFLVWGACFGSFLGLTIRLVLERRRFKRGAANERPA